MEDGPPLSEDGSVRISRVPTYSIHSVSDFVYETITLYGQSFQTVLLSHTKLNGLIPFRSPLLGESLLISFPPVT